MSVARKCIPKMLLLYHCPPSEYLLSFGDAESTFNQAINSLETARRGCMLQTTFYCIKFILSPPLIHLLVPYLLGYYLIYMGKLHIFFFHYFDCPCVQYLLYFCLFAVFHYCNAFLECIKVMFQI